MVERSQSALLIDITYRQKASCYTSVNNEKVICKGNNLIQCIYFTVDKHT